MAQNFTYFADKSIIKLDDDTELPLDSQRAFKIISEAWIRTGWDTKYVYGFSWLGRPVIQLPEDLIRIQEIIFEVKPDIIIETGVAHGGSLVFYSSILNAIGKGKVIGIDIEIRPHNRKAIEAHDLSKYITLIEGSSTDKNVIDAVKKNITNEDKVLVILDSNHLKDHVYTELNLYSQFVSFDSYIVACDGIMKEVCGAPRTEPDWEWNNPLTAIEIFLSRNDNFKLVEPKWPFNESLLKDRITYWPNAFLKRIKR